MQTLDQHQQRERARAVGQLNALSSNPLSDRQQARAEYHEALKSPELVAERAEWLLAGNYGEGAYIIARAIVEGSNRNNKVAQLSQTIAGFVWQCTGLFARQAYLKLTKDERAAVDAALAAVIADAQGGE